MEATATRLSRASVPSRKGDSKAVFPPVPGIAVIRAAGYLRRPRWPQSRSSLRGYTLPSDLDDGFSRIRRGQVLSPQIDDLGEVAHVGQDDRHLDHIGQAGAAGFQRTAQIGEGLLALRLEAAPDNAAVRVLAGLT
jgi:hypothetical protein